MNNKIEKLYNEGKVDQAIQLLIKKIVVLLLQETGELSQQRVNT